MDHNDTRCKRNSGFGWRCSHSALDGYRFCDKHQLEYQRQRKKMPTEEMFIPTSIDCPNAKEQPKVVEADTINTVEAPKNKRGRSPKMVDEHLTENVGQPDEAEHVNKRKPSLVNGVNYNNQTLLDDEDKDVNIVEYISHKAEELREAVDRSISEKTIALQNMIFREIKKCAFATTTNKKIATRFQLPFFQRTLESWKYKYTMSWMESCRKQSRENLTSAIYNIGIQREDLSTLKPRGWLSAGVIRAYATVITEMSKRFSIEGTPTVHVVNPLLYNTSRDSNDGYTVQVNNVLKGLVCCSSTPTKILIPMNLCESHWGLIMVDVNVFTITVLDSKFSRNEVTQKYRHPVNVIVQHLPMRSDGMKWITKTCPKDLPKQSNGYDCGLFILAYMECIARGISFDSGMDVSGSRVVICSDLLDYILNV